jgi:hypothetical protein
LRLLAVILSLFCFTATAQPLAFNPGILFANASTPTTTNQLLHVDAMVAASIHTVTGVSQWDDQSGNGNNFLQATGAKQPTYTGSGTTARVNFDGSNDFMAASFTLTTVETVYIVMKLNTAVNNAVLFDGFSANSFELQQGTPLPAMFINSASVSPTGFGTGTTFVVAVVRNGSSFASVSVNDGTKATTGSGIGTSNMNGFTIADRGAGFFPSNMSVAEIYVYNTNHDNATQSSIISYLRSKWGI